MLLTYRFRVKDGHRADKAALRAQARAVNFIWNFLCETQREAQRRWAAGGAVRWPSYFDLTKLTSGTSIALGVRAHTIEAVCRSFVVSRDRFGKCPSWRSGKRSLDWVPVSHADENVRLDAGGVTFARRRYRLWQSRDLPADAVAKSATFSTDARGRWYLNLTAETVQKRAHGAGEVGIDLGLSRLATLSSGETIPNLRHRGRYAVRLATAQRARNKRRAAAIHAKIANARRDQLHKASTRIMRANQRVIVGNVSSSKLAKTRFAKSVLDVGWSLFRSFLAYKAVAHQVEYAEVNEAYTSRTCSCCGTIPDSSPKGVSALGVREWTCSNCGAVHDRDVNAARNILGAARRPPVGEIAA